MIFGILALIAVLAVTVAAFSWGIWYKRRHGDLADFGEEATLAVIFAPIVWLMILLIAGLSMTGLVR